MTCGFNNDDKVKMLSGAEYWIAIFRYWILVAGYGFIRSATSGYMAFCVEEKLNCRITSLNTHKIDGIECDPCRVRDWEMFFVPTLYKRKPSLILVCRFLSEQKKPKKITGCPP